MQEGPNPKPKSTVVRATAGLVVFQIIGMLIPLLTLPVVARALGVTGFGQVMTAQAIMFLGVVFVDAGFNQESQRQVAVAANEGLAYQALLNNVLARSFCAVPVVMLMLLAGLALPDLPVALVLLSLPLIVGTLVFPQWWFVARHQGWRMGLSAVAGRLLSAGLIVALVRGEDDIAFAALASACATLVAGLITLPTLVKGLYRHRRALRFRAWRAYLASVKGTVFSGFFASASSSLPVLLLGSIAGPVQAGLFSAADRLTRAAAYVLGFIEQSLMGMLARHGAAQPQAMARQRQRLMQGLFAVVGLACLALALLTPWVLSLLYGAKFDAAAYVLRALAAWLFLFGVRKALVSFYWSATGRLSLITKIQWLEAMFVATFCLAGVVVAQARGVAIGLCAVELSLITAFCLLNKKGSK
jgi:O-antigen/teichoic acid export membrane protein